MKVTSRKAIDWFLEEIEDQSKDDQRYEEEKRQASNGWRHVPYRKGNVGLSELSPRIILPDKIPADQHHLAVMRACQLHGKTFRLYFCVLTRGRTHCLMRRDEEGGTFCPVLGGVYYFLRNHHRRTSRTSGLWIVNPHPKRKAMDKLEVEQHGLPCHGSKIGTLPSDEK